MLNNLVNQLTTMLNIIVKYYAKHFSKLTNNNTKQFSIAKMWITFFGGVEYIPYLCGGAPRYPPYHTPGRWLYMGGDTVSEIFLGIFFCFFRVGAF